MREHEHAMLDVHEVVENTAGSLNFNDALLLVLQREAAIGEMAPFDAGFGAVAGS